jgi:hypothetical protein
MMKALIMWFPDFTVFKVKYDTSGIGIGGVFVKNIIM